MRVSVVKVYLVDLATGLYANIFEPQKDDGTERRRLILPCRLSFLDPFLIHIAFRMPST